MKMTRLKINPPDTDFLQIGRIDSGRVDATTDEEIGWQQARDDAETMQEMAKFVRRVRSRLGLN